VITTGSCVRHKVQAKDRASTEQSELSHIATFIPVDGPLSNPFLTTSEILVVISSGILFAFIT